MDLLTSVGTSYVLGLLTPTTALCVIPLYPAFLARMARLAHREHDNQAVLAWTGLVVTAGVVSFMGLLGLVFTTLLQSSLQRVVGVVSPLAFAVLLVVGLAMMAGLEIRRKVRLPEPRNPLLASYLYGFFFGAIVVPCNPAFIAAFLARAVLITDPVSSLGNFLAFGVGIGTPLIAFSLVSRAASRKLVNAVVKWERAISFSAGAVMVAVSAYYLLFVFQVLGTWVG
ncbi:MAG: cytochrome C biogenesis protein [Actinobacteria bacterium HGW-Actinobacteria-8]|nr:MAG: cytochrome C biogenesis protein [Actinobacteria bacterium HGW-Actinobacteria-8]